MQNSLRQSNNSLSPTLPVKDQYGRYQVGGPIGPGDIKNAMAADPQVQMGGNMLLDVTPVVESVRSVDRLPEQWQAYQNAESPIQQVLRAAEMALEGGALVADVIPHVKALGIGGAALIGLMARRTDEIEGIARFGLAKRQQGLIGYHGSPHKFDRFRHSQMGTGEGAQAYGWGTYIAENPDVAKSYGNDLAYGIELPGAHPAANRQIARDFAGSDFNDAADIPDEWYQEIANDFREAGMDDVARSIETADKAAARAVTPNHYTVDLPDSKIAQMLDWDAPLSEQPESVRAALIRAYKESPDTDYIPKPNDTGQELYGGLNTYGGNDSQREVSLYLQSKGIPGIKYFDGNSRGAGQGTRNFVVFDENDLTILSRNGEAVGSKFRPITDDSVDGMRRYYSQRTWDTPEEAKNQIRNRIARDNEGYTIGGPTNPDIADRFEFVKSGNGYRIKQAPQKKAPIDVSNEPFEGLSMPDVDFNKADLADYNGEYNGYIRTDQLPKPKLAGGKTGYAWEEFDFKGGAFPPPTVKLNKNGTVSIVDGNHRIYRWMDEGMEQIPVKVIDSRNGESVLPTFPHDSARVTLPSGRKVRVIQNPTPAEMRGMSAEMELRYPNMPPGSVKTRHTIDEAGNYYIWEADEAMHSDIEPTLSKLYGGQMSQNNQQVYSPFAKNNSLGESVLPKVAPTPPFKRNTPPLQQAVDFYKLHGIDVPVNQLTSAQKSELTRYGKALANPSVRRRESMILGEQQTGLKINMPNDRQVIQPSDVQDSVLVPVVGDQSVTGGTLSNIGGVPLSRDVPVQGGAHYPLERKGTGYGWASMEGAARNKQNNIINAAESTGRNPIGVYSAMGDDSINFSTPVAESMIAQLNAIGIPKKDMVALNSAIRNMKVRNPNTGKIEKPFSHFVGVDSPDVYQQILGQGDFPMEAAGKLRKGIVAEMSKAKWRNKGFPVYGDVQQAINDPRLAGVNVGDSGFSMFTANPSSGLLDSPNHLTYNKGIPGEYRGGFESPVPPEIMFPDVFDALSKKVNSAGVPFPREQQVGSLRSAQLQQIADQEWVDRVSRYLETHRVPYDKQ